MKLDLVDKKILAELDVNARISIQQLAKKVRVSRDVVAYRIKQLEKHGVIQEYYTIIDYAALGLQLYRMYINFKETTPEKESEIITYLANHKQTLTVYEAEGVWDVAVGILVRDAFACKDFLSAFRLQFAQYVLKDNISLMLTLVRHSRKFLPTDSRVVQSTGLSKKKEITETDEKVLRYIVRSGRASLLTISQELGVAVNTVKYSLQKLEKEKVILGYSVNLDYSQLGYAYYKIDVQLQDTTIIPSLREYILQNEYTTYEDITIGGSDFEFDIEVDSHQKMLDVIADMKKLFPGKIHSWFYIKVRKIHRFQYITLP